MHFVNLTPRPVFIPCDDEYPPHYITPEPVPARFVEQKQPVMQICGIEFVTRSNGVVTGLPEPALDTFYIVPHMVRMAVPHRNDVVSLGEPIYDYETGCFIGYKNLVVNRMVRNVADFWKPN